MWKRVAMAMFVASMCAANTSAQSATQGQQPSSPGQQPATGGAPATTGQTTPATGQSTADQQTTPTAVETRPGTTTIMGDTGLWFVPTGEVLPARRFSVSGYRVDFNYNQGFTNAVNFPLTVAVGLGDRAEIFGAWQVVRRIDRDVRPLFITDPKAGGLVNDYPLVNSGWSGNKIGDLWLGAKVNLTSQWRQQPAAFAVRAMLKVPTADDKDTGVGTRKVDFAIDGIVSREINERVELSGFGGVIFRGDPDGVDLSNGFRWGVGVGLPTRKQLRFTAELHGEKVFSDTITITRAIVAEDGSFAPVVTTLDSPINASLGLSWVSRKGFFAGAGVNWALNVDPRSDFGSYGDETGDSVSVQARIGYHPGPRIYVAPPPPPPPPPPAPAPVHELSVKASCDPCTVDVGKVSTITATPQSSIGCTVTYNWSAPTGTFGTPTARTTPWTAPMQEGTVPVTVTVTCPQDGKTATDTVNVQVIRPAVKEIVFEDVHFDFDRYSLRPEATRALDEAVKALQTDATLRLEIEGHTCNIGTAEYNLALGERRANAVRDYLTARGIGVDRLRTVSYGEERPKHDNSREETRRLNRRAALVVRVQK